MTFFWGKAPGLPGGEKLNHNEFASFAVVEVEVGRRGIAGRTAAVISDMAGVTPVTGDFFP